MMASEVYINPFYTIFVKKYCTDFWKLFKNIFKLILNDINIHYLMMCKCEVNKLYYIMYYIYTFIY